MDENLQIVLVTIGLILLIVGIAIGVQVISDKHEIKAFNRIHGTNYTLGEWFWAERVIKDYHLGTVENKNYEVDLNVNDERLKGG